MDIREFRSRYPEYSSVDDETLTDSLYNKHYKDKIPYNTFRKTFGVGPKVNREPLDIEPVYGDSGQLLNVKDIEQGKKGAYYGGRLPKSLTVGTLAELSTSAGPQYTLNYIGPKIKQDLAPNDDWDWQDLVKEDDGSIYFLDIKTKDNPKGTDRWVKIPGFDVASAVQTVGEIGGYIGGSKLAAPVSVPGAIGGAIGTGLAAFASEMGRLKLGRTFGVNKDLPEGWEVKPSIEKGVASGVASFGGDMLFGHAAGGFGPRSDYFFNNNLMDNVFTGSNPGKPFEVVGDEGVDAVRRLHQEAIASGQAGANADELYNPSIARRTGAQELLDLEATIAEKQGSVRSIRVADKVRAQEVTSTRVLDQVLSYLVPSTGVSRAAAGTEVKAATDASLKQPFWQTGRKAAASARKSMSDHLKAIGGGRTDEETIAIIRGTQDDGVVNATGLNETLAGLKREQDEAWAATDNLVLNSATGYPGQEIPVSNISIPAEGFRQEIEKISASSKYVAGIYGTDLPEKLYQPLLRSIYNRDGSIDLAQGLHAVRDLKARYRSAVGSRDLAEGEERAVEELQKKLENHILSYLDSHNMGDITSAYTKAKQLTIDYHNFAERSIAREFLNTSRGIGSKAPYTGTGTTTLTQAFAPRVTEHAAVLRDALKHDPEAMQAAKDYLYDSYKRATTKNGIVNPEAHEKWMLDHGAQLRMFTTEQEFNQFGYLGAYAKQYEEGLARHKELMKNWKAGWGGKVGKLNSENVGKAIMSDRLGTNETTAMIRFLEKNSPETLTKVRDLVTEDLRAKLFKGTQKANVSSALDDILTPGSGRFEKLEAIYGPQYVKDLRVAYAELKKWKEYSGKSFGMPQNSTPLTLARVIFGPLSRTQRFITAARQWELQGYEKAFLEMLTDPAKLHAVLGRRNMPWGHPSIGGVVGIVGYEMFMDNPELEVPK